MLGLRVLPVLAVLASGCATSDFGERSGERKEGLGPDLRVFADDACADPDEIAGEKSLDFGGTVVAGLAKSALKSFGTFLKQVGSPEVETATGIRSGLFFAAKTASTGDKPALNPNLRCLYIVRDGFDTAGFDNAAPPALLEKWKELKLTGTPSLYAVMKLEPASDGSAFFRGTITDFTVQRFARSGGEGTRDVAIFVEFISTSNGRIYSIGGDGSLALAAAADGSGPFAHGNVNFAAVEKGQYLDADRLNGLETGWMPYAQRAEDGGQRAVNIYIDVVEMKRGNPFIADVGRFLSGEDMGAKLETEIGNALNKDKTAGVNAAIEQEQTELGLVHAVEDAAFDLSELLKDPTAEPASVRTKRRALETATENLNIQRRRAGWISAYPGATLSQAESVLSKAKQASPL